MAGSDGAADSEDGAAVESDVMGAVDGGVKGGDGVSTTMVPNRAWNIRTYCGCVRS